MPPTQLFGPFELIQRISVGGMAEVFQARHRQSGAVVALKRILPNVSEDEDFIELFHDEARIATLLEHPNIARTVDAGQVDGGHYIALEFVDGKPLRTLIDRAAASGQVLPVELALFVIAGVTAGLAYAHDRRDAQGRPLHIVHRDVSPQNILVSYDGRVKLIDFGIAKAAGKITRTQAGMIKGKVGYMSPEQVGGKDVDRRTDLFALGICLWEALTGKRLYDGPNEIVVMNKIRTGGVAAPTAENPRLPPTVDPIVLKALAKDPNQRYATASELEADLHALARSLPAPGDAGRLAQLMRQMFPSEAARAASGPQEIIGMSDKGGSDLDVFDGLAKKSGRPGPASTPAPRSLPAPTPPPGLKKTLLGLPPPTPPPQSGKNPPPPSMRAGPAALPPPSRAAGALPPPSLPPSLPPMSKPSGLGPGPLPPKPPPALAAPVDMDWDDEDEKTAVFDKEPNESPSQALLKSGPPIPGAGLPPPTSVRVGAAAALMGSSGGIAAPPSFPSPGGPSSMPGSMQSSMQSSMPGSMPGSVPGMGMHQTPASMPVASAQMPPVMPAPYPTQAPSSGAGRMILLAVAGLLVVGLVAAMVVFFIPRKGTLVVTVAGPGNKSVDAVQVFVDGNKRCDTSPCRVTELASGTHMVKVAAAGFQPTAEQGVKVETGEDAVLNVSLSRASEGTGVKVSADTAGAVKLFVDGKEVGPLPQELRDMSPGEHLIKIAGERYEAWEKRINIEEGQVQSIEPKLKVVKGLATIKGGSGAEGARVLLVSGSERRPIPKLPIKIDITTDKPWSIVATKMGFEDFKKDISFQDGKAEESFTIDLFEKGKAPKPEAPVATGGQTPTGVTPPVGIGKPPVVPDKPVAAAGTGTLNINSIPVSNVILDGRPMGSTPKVGLSVPAGNHTVVFVHAEHGRKSRVVNVPAGGAATAAVRFP